MTTEELQALFEKHEDESHKFDLIIDAKTKCPDIHAFLLLDSLVPQKRDMVSCAEHDQIWLAVDPEALAAVITEEQVITLRRCGVWYDSDLESLSMFV